MNGLQKTDINHRSSLSLWWIGLCLLIVITVILSFLRLSTPDLWTDEVLSQTKFAHIDDNIKQIARDVHPPMYFILSWWWIALTNPLTEAGLRAFSALFAVFNVVLVVILGRYLVHRTFGLLAGLVITLSPFLLQYSRMHRYYSLMVFWVILALVFLFSQSKKNYWWGIRCGLANLGLIYTNYLGAIFILGQAVILPFTYPKERRIWVKWLLGQLVIVVGFLPWLFVMAHQAARGNIAYELTKEPAPFFVIAIAKLKAVVYKFMYAGYVFIIGETTFPWMWVITIPAILLVIISVVFLLRRHGPPARPMRILLGYGLSILIIVVVLSEAYAKVFSFQSFALLPSRLLPLSPILLVAVVYGLYRISNPIAKTVLIVLFLVTEAYGTWHYFAQDQYLNPKYIVPWRKSVEYIIDRSPGVSLSCTDESSFFYYNNRLNGPPAYGVMDLLQGIRHVGDPEKPLTLWIISRYRGDPGIRLAYHELDAFCRETFAIMSDTAFAPINPKLRQFLSKITGEPAPSNILSITQYSVPLSQIGIDGIEQAMNDFLNKEPSRKRILGWISNSKNVD